MLCKCELISIGSDFNIWAWLGEILSTFNGGIQMCVTLCSLVLKLSWLHSETYVWCQTLCLLCFVNLYYIYSLLEQCHMLETIKVAAKKYTTPVQLENLMARHIVTQMQSLFRHLSASMIGIIPEKFYNAKSETFSPSLCQITFLSKCQRVFSLRFTVKSMLNNNLLPLLIQHI